jgi:1,2-dihydroxy-3-keto-5-methylthiopentene dioxygenase
MTALSVYSEEDGARILATTDPEQIRSVLAAQGIGFERWDLQQHVCAHDAPEHILAAYEDRIVRLKQQGGYTTADVIALHPDHPDRRTLREKFLSEHTHSEDEVRFFVAGRGAFFLHIDQSVLAVTCERGDLLRVPAYVRHWFDTGPEPELVAIRLFTTREGWVAQFTGDSIASRFPRLEPGGLLLA